VLALQAEYAGPLKVGTKIVFPEDGFVGTFENPNAPAST